MRKLKRITLGTLGMAAGIVFGAMVGAAFDFDPILVGGIFGLIGLAYGAF